MPVFIHVDAIDQHTGIFIRAIIVNLDYVMSMEDFVSYTNRVPIIGTKIKMIHSTTSRKINGIEQFMEFGDTHIVLQSIDTIYRMINE